MRDTSGMMTDSRKLGYADGHSVPGWAVTSSSFGLAEASLLGPGVPPSLPCSQQAHCHQTILLQTVAISGLHICLIQPTQGAAVRFSRLQVTDPCTKCLCIFSTDPLSTKHQSQNSAQGMSVTDRLLLAGQGHGFHLGGDQLPDILTVQGLLQQALQQGQPLLQAQVCILRIRQLQCCSLYTCDLLLNELVHGAAISQLVSWQSKISLLVTGPICRQCQPQQVRMMGNGKSACGLSSHGSCTCYH